MRQETEEFIYKSFHREVMLNQRCCIRYRFASHSVSRMTWWCYMKLDIH